MALKYSVYERKSQAEDTEVFSMLHWITCGRSTYGQKQAGGIKEPTGEHRGFPSGSNGKKNSTCNEGDLGWTLVSGRSPGEGICNPLQYSCLENPKDREAWQATVHRVTELNMTERRSTAQENMQLVEKGKCA